MEVKCPRCRFRFEMPVGPGVTTVQCFCPRCGQPFTYDLEAAQTSRDEAPAVGATVTEGGKVPPPVPHHRDGTVTSHAGKDMGEKPDGTERRKPAGVPTGRRQGAFGVASGVNEPPRNGVVMPQAEKKHGCLHRLVVVALSCFVVSFIAVRYCNSEKHYAAHDVQVSDDTHPRGGQAPINDVQDDGEDADTTAAEPSSSEEEMPEWVEGTWHADTDYGGIDVTISGNTIAETDGTETSKGTFHYSNNTLYCDFGDGQTFEYRVDPDKHCIDAGRGIYMAKIR